MKSTKGKRQTTQGSQVPIEQQQQVVVQESQNNNAYRMDQEGPNFDDLDPILAGGFSNVYFQEIPVLLSCDENDFRRLKSDNMLNIHFDQFVLSLQKMLNHCQKEPQQFIATYKMAEMGKGYLQIDQQTEYKRIKLISLFLVAATEEQIKQNVIYRYNVLQGRLINSKSQLRDVFSILSVQNPALYKYAENKKQQSTKLNVSFYPSYQIEKSEMNKVIPVHEKKENEQEKFKEVYVIKNGELQYPFRFDDFKGIKEDSRQSLISFVKKYSKISKFRVWSEGLKNEDREIKHNITIQSVKSTQDKDLHKAQILDSEKLKQLYGYEEVNEEKEENSQYFYILWTNQNKQKEDFQEYNVQISNSEGSDQNSYFLLMKHYKTESQPPALFLDIEREQKTEETNSDLYENKEIQLKLEHDNIVLYTQKGQLFFSNVIMKIENEQIKIQNEKFVLYPENQEDFDVSKACDKKKEKQNQVAITLEAQLEDYDNLKIKIVKNCEKNIKAESKSATDDDNKIDPKQDIINQKTNSKSKETKDSQKSQQQDQNKDEQKTTLTNLQIQTEILGENHGNTVDSGSLIIKERIIETTDKDLTNFFIRKNTNNQEQKDPEIYFKVPKIQIDDKKQQKSIFPKVNVFSKRNPQHNKLFSKGYYHLDYNKERDNKSKIQLVYNCQIKGTVNISLIFEFVDENENIIQEVSIPISKQCENYNKSKDSDEYDGNDDLDNNIFYQILFYSFCILSFYMGYRVISCLKNMIKEDSEKSQQQDIEKMKRKYDKMQQLPDSSVIFRN